MYRYEILKPFLSRESDELVIMEVNDWVIENFEKFKEKAEPVKTLNKNAEVEFIRLWIYSHHIYSNEKRRNISSLSENLDLTGFILPGKPGIICVEGESSKVHQFYTQIKRYFFIIKMIMYM